LTGRPAKRDKPKLEPETKRLPKCGMTHWSLRASRLCVCAHARRSAPELLHYPEEILELHHSGLRNKSGHLDLPGDA
jgi:hypothetical protein